jgi:hypothetical protein
MIPLDLAQDGGYATVEAISTTFLVSGTHFHLWFLSSLILGLLVIRVTDEYEVPWLLPVCAIGALVVAVWLGTYWSFESRNFGRHLSSIFYLWMGLVLSKRGLGLKQSIALIVAGIGIEIVEASLLHAQGKVVWLSPTMLGTVPLALGIFGIASTLRNTPLLEKLGGLGVRFTGCIYVTHVYFIWIVDHAATALGVHDNVVYCALVVPTVFLMNLLTLMLIDRLAPICIDVLLGEKSAIQRLGRKFTVLPKASEAGAALAAASKRGSS